MQQPVQYQPVRIHGGQDALGAAPFDFSTNSNACGPCPSALGAVQQANASQYPDASYSALRRQLAALHAVDEQRVVLAASASEFIFRITSLVARLGGRSVAWPPYSYGDYAHAASANGLEPAQDPLVADLCWACDPSSPMGSDHKNWQCSSSAVRVIDRAYEPLRLSGEFDPAVNLNNFWQLYSPNKALGLTGVRAAYAVAPTGQDTVIDAMNQLCPSWPIGAHGVAMLQIWSQADTQAWLNDSLIMLRQWKSQQTALCLSLGWAVLPSTANFFVCQADIDLAALRHDGVKLRDCASFGLPGHVRVSVQPPTAQDALHRAWRRTKGRT